MFNEKQRLHFASAIIEAFIGFKSFIIPVFLVLAANGFNVKMNSFESIVQWIPILVILALFITAVVRALIKWLTFTYWIDEGELKTEYGLLVKSKRYVPIERIQSLNYHEGIVHRLFKLQQVSVETAGGGDGGAEVVLSAVSKEVAHHFETEINALRLHQNVVGETVELDQYDNAIYKITDKNLVLHATTSNGIGVVLASIGALITQLIQFIPEERLSKQFFFSKEEASFCLDSDISCANVRYTDRRRLCSFDMDAIVISKSCNSVSSFSISSRTRMISCSSQPNLLLIFLIISSFLPISSISFASKACLSAAVARSTSNSCSS